MSSSTWTPDALRSEARPYEAQVWRFVEEQSISSTMKLVDDVDDQLELEMLLDEHKPPVPKQCEKLHYLLSTPFRYGPYPHGSRFRRAGLTLGVFYAAENSATAAYEMAFYRVIRFFDEAPGIVLPKVPVRFTAFSVRIGSEMAIDLMAPPLSKDKDLWTDPVQYGPCQDVADAAREAGASVIRYESVRDPGGGANVAVLDCSAFTETELETGQGRQETWHFMYQTGGTVQALRESPRTTMKFTLKDFERDHRVRRLLQERR